MNNAVCASRQTNPFQGTWEKDYGSVKITNCKGKQCDIEIHTSHGASLGDVEEKLRVVSKNKAIFYVKNPHYYSEENKENKKKFNLNKVFLAYPVIRIEVTSGALLASCGIGASYEGKYSNSKVLESIRRASIVSKPPIQSNILFAKHGI